MTNANLFRRYARIEDDMLRATMPKTSARDVAAVQSATRVVMGSRNGVRLVKVASAFVGPLTASISERMVG